MSVTRVGPVCPQCGKNVAGLTNFRLRPICHGCLTENIEELNGALAAEKQARADLEERNRVNAMERAKAEGRVIELELALGVEHRNNHTLAEQRAEWRDECGRQVLRAVNAEARAEPLWANRRAARPRPFVRGVN